MYARAASQFRRSSQLKSFLAPVAGWIANRELASPNGIGQKQGAAILDNFFPTTTGALLRRGKDLYATLGDGTQNATSIFSYVVGNNRKLFASTDDAIYDITSVPFPDNLTLVTENGDYLSDENGNHFGMSSTEGLDVWTDATGGNWITVQMATTGGIFLLGVNGQSTGFIFDGTAFYPNVAGGVWALSYDAESVAFTVGETLTGGTSGATATILDDIPGTTPGEGALLLTDIVGDFEDNETITDGEGGEATAASVATNVVPGVDFGPNLTSADMSFVLVYKRRVYFIQKDSLSFWYLEDPDAVGGEAIEFPMGGEFTRGGSLLFGSPWSTDGGGGFSDRLALVSTEGQVIDYQGGDPSNASDWAKVGEYRIGSPLGNRAFVRAGGDIVIDTSIGAVPLTQAVQRDYSALSPSAISFSIEDAWNGALVERGATGWCSEIWPESQMMLVSPPTTLGSNDPVIFVANVRTGAWARYTNWHAICMHVFMGRLYFGSPNGQIYLGNVTGFDGDETYTGVYVPLFEDFGAPASIKVAQVGRAVTRSQAPLNERLEFHTDFDMTLPPRPDATSVLGGSEWNVGLWGVAVWNDTRMTVVDQDWQSLGGLGYMGTLSYQVTSGALVPLDAELVRLDLTFTVADIVS